MCCILLDATCAGVGEEVQWTSSGVCSTATHFAKAKKKSKN